MKNLNKQQKECLQKFLSENEFEAEIGSEWTNPKVIHSLDVEKIYKKLRELE